MDCKFLPIGLWCIDYEKTDTLDELRKLLISKIREEFLIDIKNWNKSIYINLFNINNFK